MNVGRTFWKLTRYARAARFWLLLALAALAWLGLGGEARAQQQTIPGPNCGDFYCTREDAFAACEVSRLNMVAIGYTGLRCLPSPESGPPYEKYQCLQPGVRMCNGRNQFPWVSECPTGYTWDDDSKTCGLPCDGKDPITSAHALGDSDSFCSDGCAYSCSGFSMLVTIDGQLRTVCAGPWTTSGTATCSVGELPAPIDAVTDSDGDGTSDEYDLSPNNPGESGDGSGQDVSRACGGPGQPECLPDGSNEGSGRGNTSGGGGDCNTPPRSSGDAILAQIAFQTWATRCAIEGTANSGAGTGSGSGDGGEGVLDQLRAEAAGLDQSLGDGDAEAAWIEGPTMLDLDTGGLGIGGTCPAPPTINGVSIDPDGNLCMLVQIIGALVLVGAYVHAGYIIGRA